MHKPARPALSGRQGFSLAELLVVIVIIGITARFAIPAFTGVMSGTRVSGAVSVVQSDLALARLQAIRRGAAASFRAAGTSSYTVTIDTSATILRTVKTGSLADYRGATVAAPGGIVTFNSRGTLLVPALASGTSYARVMVTVTRGSVTKTDSVQVYASGRIVHAQ